MLDDASAAYIHALTTGNDAEADRLARVLDTATLLEQGARDRVRLGDAALRYARDGIPVFPIRPGGKQPLTGHGFKDATTDPTTVTDWWRQWPDANIGVPTGIAFDVIDIDGREGIVSMYHGAQARIDTVTVIGVALTSRDGGRHIYVPVSGHGNKASIYPGVDYRGAGGYVVAPPSIGANGRRYRWSLPLALEQVAAA